MDLKKAIDYLDNYYGCLPYPCTHNEPDIENSVICNLVLAAERIEEELNKNIRMSKTENPLYMLQLAEHAGRRLRRVDVAWYDKYDSLKNIIEKFKWYETSWMYTFNEYTKNIENIPFKRLYTRFNNKFILYRPRFGMRKSKFAEDHAIHKRSKLLEKIYQMADIPNASIGDCIELQLNIANLFCKSFVISSFEHLELKDAERELLNEMNCIVTFVNNHALYMLNIPLLPGVMDMVEWREYLMRK